MRVLTPILLYFNSIKVRLERYEDAGINPYFALFQFHKGTIRTTYDDDHLPLFSLFQFHKGTIRTKIWTINLYGIAISIP